MIFDGINKVFAVGSNRLLFGDSVRLSITGMHSETGSEEKF